ncbi:unnamed protein product [Ceratitis capitata]|uniref:(Mediterranean fruit fly) hypothetical protein n=1 Tax=Ceratitis capitata TaxID=7213 RepID=A0A811TXX9_CERCA|nr:unnamed protein product [Ceratitis capitata]
MFGSQRNKQCKWRLNRLHKDALYMEKAEVFAGELEDRSRSLFSSSPELPSYLIYFRTYFILFQCSLPQNYTLLYYIYIFVCMSWVCSRYSLAFTDHPQRAL